MAKIALFGGAFDPIHRGHLAIAEHALEQLAFDQVRFIPCANPVHKAPCIATGEQRATMIALAIWTQPKFCLDRCELERPSASYTIDTIEHIIAQHGIDHQYSWLMGMDEFLTFKSWHRWQEIITLVDLAVVNRGEVAPEVLAPLLASLTAEPHRIQQLTMPAQPQASRIIRSQRTLNDLPLQVAEFIQAQQLYQ